MARDDEPLEYFVVLHIIERATGRVIASVENAVTREYLMEGVIEHKLELEQEWGEVHDDVAAVMHSVTKL